MHEVWSDCSAVLTISGLLIDIVGAAIVAWFVFASSPVQAANAGYLGRTQVDAGIFYGTELVAEKCREANFVRIGIVVLTLGFWLQILGQLAKFMDVTIFGGLTFVIMMASALFLSALDEWYRKAALIEHCLRMVSFSKGSVVFNAGFEKFELCNFAKQIAPQYASNSNHSKSRKEFLHILIDDIEKSHRKKGDK